MSRVVDIKGRVLNQEIVDFRVEVSETEPWTLRYVGLDRNRHDVRARDLFEALVNMRQDLERSDCQLLCAGARADVTPSGMSRSMTGGRKAYVIHLGQPASLDELVDIFEYAAPDLVGTVKQQQRYLEQWINSLKHRVAPKKLNRF